MADTSLAHRLAAAQRLLDVGLGSSALALLEEVPVSPERSALRRKARRLGSGRLARRIHALGVDGSVGIALPFDVELGTTMTGAWDEAAEEAQLRALECTWAVLGEARRELRYRMVVADCFRIDGHSLGLPAALAFLALLSGRPPRVPVLATGRLDAHGNVGKVECVAEKLRAAADALGGQEAVVLVPHGEELHAPAGLKVVAVHTLREALEPVFGSGGLKLSHEHLGVDELLDRVEQDRASSAQEKLRQLDGLDEGQLTPGDRLRVLALRGTQLRHLGHSEEAARLHEEARRLSREDHALSRSALETFEMEELATRLDLFEYETLERDLRARLERSFDVPHNRVRCQGMLAQVLSELGSYAEALVLRDDNLLKQVRSAEMREEIPRTLCPLALDAARAGDAARFDDYARRLRTQTTRAPDQPRYNQVTLVRGFVLLGRYREALEEGAPLLEAPSIGRHPEVSTARALVRALRRLGETERAQALAGRVAVSEGPGRAPLVDWLALLARVEGLLAADVQDPGCREALAGVATRLERAHPRASRFHARLVDRVRAGPLDEAGVAQLEHDIDRVFY